MDLGLAYFDIPARPYSGSPLWGLLLYRRPQANGRGACWQHAAALAAEQPDVP
jgi:hypothetical protein